MRYRLPILIGLFAAAVLFLALAMAGFAIVSAVLSALALGFAAFVVWISVKRVIARNFGSGSAVVRRPPPT
jgi:hypothetical protein